MPATLAVYPLMKWYLAVAVHAGQGRQDAKGIGEEEDVLGMATWLSGLAPAMWCRG